jgi:hydroxymethylpyrimidine/phosphomethylpyrimidine kinase
MVLDQEHIEIVNKISAKLQIPVKEVVLVIKDFTAYNKDQLSKAIRNTELDNNFKLTIPNCFSFYNTKGRIKIKKEKKINRELKFKSSETSNLL